MTESAQSGSGGQSRGGTAASLLTVPIFKDTRPRRGASLDAEPPLAASSAEHDGAQTMPAAGPSQLEDSPEPRPSQPSDRPPQYAEPDGNDLADLPKTREALRYRNLPHYWRRLGRGGQPAVEDLDDRLIAANWPYTLLIRVPNQGAPLDIVRVFSSADGSNGGGAHPLAGDRYSQLSSWLLQLAREVAGAGEPVETVETFSLDRGATSFDVRVLPCGSRADSDASYILLNVTEV